MPINSCDLRSKHPTDNSKVIETCPGCKDAFTATALNPNLITPPYICLKCHLLGWRSRGNYAYNPEETI